MKFSAFVILVTCAALALLTGCSNPRDATERNFKKSLQNHFSTVNNAICLDLPISEKGAAHFARPTFHYIGVFAFYDALTAAGVLKREEHNRRTVRVRGTTEERFDVRYTVSSDHRHLLVERPRRVSLMVAHMMDICFGRKEIVEIQNFSEPSDLFGSVVSSVKFTYRYVDLPAFMSHDSMKGLERNRIGNIARGILPQGKAILVLTNNGWVHESAI